MEVVEIWQKLLSKPGTAQVGPISKAQNYPRNNNWKHLKNFSQEKVFGEKVAYCQ